MVALAVASVLVAGILYAAAREDRRGLLTVSFLDIGQGDAIFIDAPSGRQVLIDGGPDASVLRELSSVSPWWDRTIDVVIVTHPDLDHSNGMTDVFARYRVAHIYLPSVTGETSDWRVMLDRAHREGAITQIAERGQIIDLGGGARIEILFPDRALPHVETNLASTIVRVVYGDTAILLTGDSPDEIELYLVGLHGRNLQADVLKVGHHGSKTSSASAFLSAVEPTYAVFSRGCDNRYGHPAPEVVERFKSMGIETFDTCEAGTITFVSNGQTITRR